MQNFLKLTSIISFSILLHPQDMAFWEESKFSVDIISEHFTYLASDLLMGRGVGTTSELLAAKYLANEFKKAGLKPLGSNNDFFQFIPLHGSIPQQKTELIIHYSNHDIPLVLNHDYVLYNTGQQTFLSGKFPIVFVGYGITAPEYDYNDYQNIDISGKVAVFLEGEPLSNDDNYFEGEKPTIYSYSKTKQLIALSRGAVGSILIPFKSKYSKSKWEKILNDFSFENVSLATSINQNLSILINPLSAYYLFQNSLYELNEVYQMHEKNNMQSFFLNCQLSFKGHFVERDFLSPNVIGLLEGSDPVLRDSYIIISAHYDHLGIGPSINGDSIYNGAFDNAIGIAGLLELVRIFSKEKQNLKRSLIFLCVTAEEKGLLGSYYYTTSPPIPLYKTIANVNIDGLAVFDRFKSVVGIGSEYSSLGKYLEKVASKLNLTVSTIPEGFANWTSFYVSDQAAFAQAGVPSILSYEGLEPENKSFDETLNWYINFSENIYHSPFDDLNQAVNFAATIQHLSIIYDFINELANSKDEPYWYDFSPFLSARLISKAERK